MPLTHTPRSPLAAFLPLSLPLALLLLLGCGDDPALDDPSTAADYPVAGSRLKRVFWQPESGAGIFVGFHDTQLGVDCTFIGSVGSPSACVPDFDVLSRFDGKSFFDEACTRPALFGAATKLTIQFEQAGCNFGSKVLRAGAELQVDALYELKAGACVRSDRPGPLLVREAVDVTSMYVSAVDRAGAGAGGMAAVWYDASDGTRAFRSWIDLGRGLPCVIQGLDGDLESFPLRGADGAIRCLPIGSSGQTTPNVFDFRYVDARCTARAVPASAPTCPHHVETHHVAVPSSCPRAFRVMGRGSLVTASYSRPRNASCQTTPGGAEPAHAWEELPASTFPAVRLTDPVGAGRIQARYHETAAGRTWAGAHDSALGVDCRPGRDAQGETRCFPVVSASGSGAYEDAACTKELVEQPFGSCRETAPRFVSSRSRAAGVSLLRAFRVEPPRKGPIYGMSAGPCKPVSSEAAAQRNLARVVRELRPSELALLRRVVR